MTADAHARFEQLSSEGKLLDPHVPGKNIATLIMAPVDEQWKNTWNGKFFNWDEPCVTGLSQ